MTHFEYVATTTTTNATTTTMPLLLLNLGRYETKRVTKDSAAPQERRLFCPHNNKVSLLPSGQRFDSRMRVFYVTVLSPVTAPL
jgi:hypothetical protein